MLLVIYRSKIYNFGVDSKTDKKFKLFQKLIFYKIIFYLVKTPTCDTSCPCNVKSGTK